MGCGAGKRPVTEPAALGERRELGLREGERLLYASAADELDELLLLQLEAELRISSQDRRVHRVGPLDRLLDLPALHSVADDHAVGHGVEVDSGCNKGNARGLGEGRRST